MPTLSEVESKALLARHGVPFLAEQLVSDQVSAVQAATEMGFPVVAKLCGAAIAHKTERGLVKLGLADAEAVEVATVALLAAGRPEDGVTGVLIAPMISGNRELIAGIADDVQFGRVVMLGVGGILAEAIADVTFRMVPVSRLDAAEMIDELQTQILLGAFRGEPAVDRERLIDVLVGLSAAVESDTSIVSADLNPLIVVDGQPVAVDALVERSAS